MIEVHEAQRLLASECAALAPVELAAETALHHVLARDARSDRDLPAADLATMDGFAIRAADAAEAGAVLRIAGEIRAGEPLDRAVGAGEALRIFTGALLPSGADTVVMVEKTREVPGAGRVEILAPAVAGEHIRRRAEDAQAGAVVLSTGQVLHAAEIATLTSIGSVRVSVHPAPVVHVLSTGDELVEADQAPLAHQVRDSNRTTLLALLRQMGLAGVSLGVARDEPSALDEVLRRGLQGDVLLVTGGVSMGAYDLVGQALARAGMRLVFHQVAVRPGKPILVGRAGACLVVGLPGNPVSTFTCFTILVAPAIRKLMGYARSEPLELRARLASPVTHRPGRTTYHLARLEVQDATLLVRPTRTMGSGDVGSLARANAFLVTAGAARQLAAGEEVTTIPWHEFQAR